MSILACAAPGVADEPRAQLRQQVVEYVAELRSPLRSERVRAEQALLELGPTVLDLLPAPDETPDQATRMAVRQIRIRLERVAAERSVLPTRVTLRGMLNVQDVASRIERQTGNRIKVDRLSAAARDKAIDVNWQDVPFWECLSGLGSDASIGWEMSPNDEAVALVDGVPTVAPGIAADDSPAFRTAIESLTCRRGTLRASLQLTAEPRLRPLFVRIADADFVAAADDKPLPLFSPQAVTELPMTSRGPARFAVLFRIPDDAEFETAALRGSVTVHVAAAPTDVRFDDLSGQRVEYKRHGGVSVTLKRAELVRAPERRQDLVVRLAVSYDSGGPEFESHRTWIYHNDVRLENADGDRLAPETDFEIDRTADGSIELEYRFKGLTPTTLPDWQLVYVAPMLLVDVPVEFDFEEVPVGKATAD